MKALEIMYFIKSLFVEKDSHNIFHSFKNPKYVMRYIAIIFIICLLFLKNVKYYKEIFVILLLMVYAWKRYKDGDFKYWYRKRMGWKY